MNRLCLFLLVAFLALSGSRLPSEPITERGNFVTLKIPSVLLERVSGWLGEFYVAKIEPLPFGARVQSYDDWQVRGFPSMIGAVVQGAEWKKKRRSGKRFIGGYTEVKLLTRTSITIKLRFMAIQPGPELNAAFQEVVVQGPPHGLESREYAAEIYDVIAERALSGPLAGLTQEKKRLVVRFADRTASARSVATTPYGGNHYLMLDLGNSGIVYDGERFGQALRISLTVSQRLLPVIRAFASLPAIPQVYGLHLMCDIFHREGEGQEIKTETFQIYVSGDLARDGVSDQDLASGSVAWIKNQSVSVQLEP